MKAAPYTQISASGWNCCCHSETCSIISANRWLIFPDLSIGVPYLREDKPKQTKIHVSWHPALFHLSVPKPRTIHKAEQETFCTSPLCFFGFVFSLAIIFKMSSRSTEVPDLFFSLSRNHQCLTLPLQGFPRGDGLGTAWWDTTLSGLSLLLSSAFLEVPQQTHSRQGEDSGPPLSLHFTWKVKRKWSLLHPKSP